MISLICATTIWINLTKDPWNDYDKGTYKRAVQVCKTEVQCVKKFIKKEKKVYWVICGY